LLVAIYTTPSPAKTRDITKFKFAPSTIERRGYETV
jgi:hypothetical protein